MKGIWIILYSVIIFSMSCESNILEPIQNGTAGIQFSVSKEGNVLFEIENRYDAIVKSVDLGILAPGVYRQEWDFTDNDGNYVNEGIYFIYIYLDDEPIISGNRILVFNYE